jgi:murein DD-endopeptidase MepM/ murein hydrolase activator NlpD
MRAGFVTRLKTIAITATLTTLSVVALGAWWYGAHRSSSGSLGQSARLSLPWAAPDERKSSPSRPSAGSAAGKLLIPVAGVKPDQLADTFTQARDEGQRRHDAIDIMAPLGTPVLAATSGRVEKLYLSQAGGNTIYVRSPDRRRVYYYAHLDAYAAGINEGDILRRGQRIGTVGYTGNASPDGPHLHFAVLATLPQQSWHGPSAPLNPYPLLTGKRPPQ